MNDFNASEASELGAIARNHFLEDGDEICRHEKARLELVNEAEIVECQARLKVLSHEREQIQCFLRGILHPSAGTRARRRYYLTVALVLGLAGFSFAHLALSPFGIGMYVWPYSAGLALVCVVLTDFFLEKCGGVRTVQILAVGAFLASLTGLVILAIIRGDIVLMYLKSAASESLSDAAVGTASAIAFYEDSVIKLRLFFALLAGSMELATGFMVWEARKVVLPDHEGVGRARQRLSQIDDAMPPLVRQIVFLQNEPQAFEAEFKRDYRRGLLRNYRSRGSLRVGQLVIGGLLGLAITGVANAQALEVVIGLDFSQSDAAALRNRKTAHEESVEAAARTLEALPAGTRFSVVGITDASFSKPLILLAGQIPKEHGSLGLLDRIALSREKYGAALRRTAGMIPADAPSTDVLGALTLAADILRRSPSKRRILILYGDMRQSASPVNIERPVSVPTQTALRSAKAAHLLANLKDVDVYSYGVHADGKSVKYWRSLREFWEKYFLDAGANLRTFSILWDIPDFGSIGDEGR